MQTKRGIAVSPGVAISRAVVLDAADQPIPRRIVDASKAKAELKRLHEALTQSCQDIEKLRDRAVVTVGSELAGIFTFHLGMLRDPHLVGQFTQLIEADHTTAEYAVYAVMRKLAGVFQQQKNEVYRQRVTDIWDLERRVLGYLIGHTRQELSHLDHEAVVVASDLTPSQTAALDTTKIKGLATDAGGQTSHTAILAHALGIPAIVGLEDLTSRVNTGDTVIIDGNQGSVIIDPDAQTLLEYRQSLKRFEAFETKLDELAELPAVTRDGTEITLLANIEFPDEINAALKKGAMGIGLYRTEFLFLAAAAEPTEQQQYDTYKAAVDALGGLPLTIRTIDLGADKLSEHEMKSSSERNPFLGCRSIRYCLQNLPMFKTQLRAVLRAGVGQSPIRIMFPFITNIMEFRQAKMILNDVMEDLEDQGIDCRSDVEVGIMVEVPSTALQAQAFSQEVDFFSIGTNDLIQYTLAVDRGNERVANLYSGAHPAVIQLLRDIIRNANRAGVDISLCGEMAGQSEFVMLLIGLGLRTFSITPPAIPEVKRVIRSVSVEQCRRVARKVRGFDSDRETHLYLLDEVSKVIPRDYLV